MTMTRAAALGLAALAGYAAVVITVPGQARAGTADRYWAYYVAHGASWQYSQRGPATEHPVDGEVQGWRFAVQVDAANGLLPRAAPAFATLCASTPAEAGELRVGVVIDFGLATDAPAHERPPAAVVPGCVYVHDGGTGADVLAAAAAVRIGTGSDAGLVCGIDGYPRTECAVAVATRSTAPAPPTQTPAPASPRVAPSTRPPTAATPASSRAAAPTAAGQSASVPAPETLAAASSGSARPATASALSLAALRSSTRRGHGIQAITVVGIGLIVVLGAGALWRTRVRGR
ncbi:MAG TPA: SCO2322 family protein [Acidothermaceae bacterium]